jgi:hypothetical protein
MWRMHHILCEYSYAEYLHLSMTETFWIQVILSEELVEMSKVIQVLDPLQS